MEELEPLFCDRCRLRSNLLDIDDEEPLFVVDLASQEKARAREFSNGNGECGEDNF
jgi:c-di-GMP-binding flagellar brake protein YcgR